MNLLKYYNDFVRLIYPRTCAGCGSDRLGAEHLLCWHCISQLPGTGFENKRGNLVEELFAGRLPLEMASSLLFFSKNSLVQHIVHRIKYRGITALGIDMGTLMGEAIFAAHSRYAFDLIVPLPLNDAKERKRGFNQASLLARGMADRLNIPVNEISVVRTHFTETQTRKSRAARWENVGEVFKLVDRVAVTGKHVLLVDDVVTTGATLDACGQALLAAPGLKLSIATLAFASTF